jgi:hypothetical protein
MAFCGIEYASIMDGPFHKEFHAFDAADLD